MKKITIKYKNIMKNKILIGWFYFVPIFYTPKTGEIRPRHFLFSLPLDFMFEIHSIFIYVMSHFVEESFEFSYPIKITGQIIKYDR